MPHQVQSQSLIRPVNGKRAHSVEKVEIIFCCASMSADVGSVIMLLLSRGADPDVSSLPLNPMFYTVLGGEVNVVKKLLESGAKTDQYLPDEVCKASPVDASSYDLTPFLNTARWVHSSPLCHGEHWTFLSQHHSSSPPVRS